MSGPKPRCARCGRRYAKDPRPVRATWLTLGSERYVCPGCATDTEATRVAIIDATRDPAKLAASEASGERWGAEDLLRDDLDPETRRLALELVADTIREDLGAGRRVV